MINVGGEWLASQRVMGEESPPFASPPACRATKFSRRPQGRGVGVDRGALRWPWGGGSGEAQLGLGSGGREGWGLGAEAQMMEDPARDERVGEGGDAVAAAAARGAAQHVHRGLWLPLHMAGSISVLALIVIHVIVVTRYH